MTLITGGTNIQNGSVTIAKMAAGTQGEAHINIVPQNYSAIIQGTFVTGTGYGTIGGAGFVTSAPAQNDELNYVVFLAAGTYTIIAHGMQGSDKGITTFYVDATSAGTMDWYNGAPTIDNRKTITNVAVATAGLKTLKVKAATKNASASGYGFGISNITLYRTA